MQISTSQDFMRRAIGIAMENVRLSRGGPFGALVVKGAQIVSESANSVTRTNDPTAHAEILAIRGACAALGTFQLSGCDLYTSCQPCPMCLGAIYWARPSRVYYAGTMADAAAAGFDDGFIYAEIQRAPDERSIPMMQILREDSLDVFSVWLRSGNKTAY